MWGDRFVARFDPKVERKKKTFIIRNLVFEQDFAAFDAFLPQFVEKLVEFAQFNGCERFAVERVSPSNQKRALVESLAPRCD